MEQKYWGRVYFYKDLQIFAPDRNIVLDFVPAVSGVICL